VSFVVKREADVFFQGKEKTFFMATERRLHSIIRGELYMITNKIKRMLILMATVTMVFNLSSSLVSAAPTSSSDSKSSHTEEMRETDETLLQQSSSTTDNLSPFSLSVGSKKSVKKILRAVNQDRNVKKVLKDLPSICSYIIVENDNKLLLTSELKDKLDKSSYLAYEIGVNQINEALEKRILKMQRGHLMKFVEDGRHSWGYAYTFTHE